MHFYTFRLKIIFNPPLGVLLRSRNSGYKSQPPASTAYLRWESWWRQTCLVCVSLDEILDCHRWHSTSSSTYFHVGSFYRTFYVRISAFGRGLLSDSRRLDAASGADVSAPGGPRVRRFPAAQPLRAVLWRCRAVAAVVVKKIPQDCFVAFEVWRFFLFRRKLGISGLDFGLWGVFEIKDLSSR